MTFTHVGDYQDANNTATYGGAFMTPFSIAAGVRAIITVGNYSALANVGLPTITDSESLLTPLKLNESIATGANVPTLSQWIVEPEEDFTGTLTLTFASTQRGIAVSVETITDASPAEPVRLANLPTPSRGTGTGVTSTLATLSAAASVHLYAVAHHADEVTTPGSGFTELADLHFADAGNSTAFALEVAYKANDTTADPSWATSSAYAIASLEIQAADVAAPDQQDVWQPVWLAGAVLT